MVEPQSPPEPDDNPVWTEADFTDARPADQIHAPEIAASLVRRSAERETVVLELDADVAEKFRATGPGWQARINDALRAVHV